MKKVFVLALSLLALTVVRAQKWSELSQEEKIMKAKEFRADNQAYLKNTMGMTQTQLDDIDNVNICFLSTLDRIDRYGKDDATKEKYAKAVSEARWGQLDAIMGADKHKKYAEYLKGKIEKAKAANKG
ncbi:MAG: hypothetical protein C5B52_16365 [Bacteroidetes bacterium]|nr:MAG: hypothetical protein C5B52_16365 [Bacteroidota bacterium]